MMLLTDTLCWVEKELRMVPDLLVRISAMEKRTDGEMEDHMEKVMFVGLVVSTSIRLLACLLINY